MDAVRELPQLVDCQLQLALRLLEELGCAVWLAVRDTGRVVQALREPGQSQLRAVVEIVLDPPAGVVRGRDQPQARRAEAHCEALPLRDGCREA